MKYFGTDGFRGNANVNLTVIHAFKIGRYVGWYYGLRLDHKAKVVIGKDTRRSSYMFEYALVAGLVASGADAYLLHVTTTPSVSFVVRSDGFDCGIMITASHNPFYDNGIKLINCDGQKLEPAVLNKIETYLDGETELPLATGNSIGRTVDYVEGRNRYIGNLISTANYSLKGYRIGLDCANGSSSPIAKGVFDALGAKTHVINDAPDGFNINVNCGSTHIEALQKFVLENSLDVGFAFDGDADRCIAVDDKGRVVNGDLILYVCGNYLAKNGMLAKNTIVTTVMANMGLYKALDKAGLHYEKTAVGDKNVYACMLEKDYCLGGEQSGHVIFSKYETTGDGIMTSLRIMEAMTAQKQKLSSLVTPVKIYPQMLKNLSVKNKKEAMNASGIQESITKVESFLGEEGRVLVRESGTEPLVRVMVEAATQELCSQGVETILQAFNKLEN